MAPLGRTIDHVHRTTAMPGRQQRRRQHPPQSSERGTLGKMFRQQERPVVLRPESTGTGPPALFGLAAVRKGIYFVDGASNPFNLLH